MIYLQTSIAMTATLYLLAINQHKQDILREEVMSPEGERTYLKACIKEALRMMPVSAGNARETTKDYCLRGYHVPKGVSSNNTYLLTYKSGLRRWRSNP